jgi:hypothetical protein
MVRNPKTSIAKDLVHTRPLLTELEWKTQRAAISQCGLALAGDIPIMNEFYFRLGRDCELPKNYVRFEITGMDMLASRMSQKYCEPSTETRVSFFKAFGLTPDFQTAMEDFYRGVAIGWIPTNLQEQGFPVSPSCIWT